MLEIFKYGKKVDISCFICDKVANFDIHIASKNGGFVNVNVCENCLNQLKEEFSAFDVPDKIKL